jgi:hypothetical protein
MLGLSGVEGESGRLLLLSQGGVDGPGGWVDNWLGPGRDSSVAENSSTPSIWSRRTGVVRVSVRLDAWLVGVLSTGRSFFWLPGTDEQGKFHWV